MLSVQYSASAYCLFVDSFRLCVRCVRLKLDDAMFVAVGETISGGAGQMAVR